MTMIEIKTSDTCLLWLLESSIAVVKKMDDVL